MSAKDNNTARVNAQGKTHYIYQLMNMTTREIFYVGRTTKPAQRLAQHWGNITDAPISMYMQQAKEKGHEIEMFILDSIETDEVETAKSLESCWQVMVRRMGNNLVNAIRGSAWETPNVALISHQMAMLKKYPNSAERKAVALRQMHSRDGLFGLDV